MWKTKDHNVSETGSVSVLRWMGQDKPTQLGPLERASLNHWIEFKTSPIALYNIHHRQNPFKSILGTSLSQTPISLSPQNSTQATEGSTVRPPPYVPRASMFSPPFLSSLRHYVDMTAMITT
jgi:hypothetical protein